MLQLTTINSWNVTNGLIILFKTRIVKHMSSNFIYDKKK